MQSQAKSKLVVVVLVCLSWVGEVMTKIKRRVIILKSN